MPLVRTRAQAFEMAIRSWVGNSIISLAMALDDSIAASIFSAPMWKRRAGVACRRVRRAMTWLEAAIISSHLKPSVFQARATSRGECVFKIGFLSEFGLRLDGSSSSEFRTL